MDQPRGRGRGPDCRRVYAEVRGGAERPPVQPVGHRGGGGLGRLGRLGRRGPAAEVGVRVGLDLVALLLLVALRRLVTRRRAGVVPPLERVELLSLDLPASGGSGVP